MGVLLRRLLRDLLESLLGGIEHACDELVDVEAPVAGRARARVVVPREQLA